MKSLRLAKFGLGVIAVTTNIGATRVEALEAGRVWIENNLNQTHDRWSRMIRATDEELGRLATVGIASAYAVIMLMGHKLIRGKREV